MPKICYVPRRFLPDNMAMIENANKIIAEYEAAGYLLTLRQLYYQFVSRDLIPNTVQEYKHLGQVVNDARLAGLIDWNAIEDRTRNLHKLPHWEDPADIIGSAAASYAIDKWATQPYRVEVWIEKEALAGVFQRVCDELSVPLFACRGYTSQSEMWAASQRLIRYEHRKQRPYILHFGDHDPSGIDMSRDIKDRLRTFGVDLKFERIALNMDQVEEYTPPPNPAKETDARFKSYSIEYGDESWELDALDPTVLANLVRTQVQELLDEDKWKDKVTEEREDRDELTLVADHWVEAVDGIHRTLDE